MKRVLLCLIAGALLTSTATFADTYDNLPPMLKAPQPTGASCVSLQRQFDAEIVTHANKPRAASAPARMISSAPASGTRQAMPSASVSALLVETGRPAATDSA